MRTHTGSAGIRPYVWMLCGCFWFSLMAMMAHEVGGRCDWQVVAIARSGLATVFALTLAIATGARLVFWKPGILWLRSIAGSCSMVATFYAMTQKDFPLSNVLTLTNTFPIWVALLSWPLIGERPSLGAWIAAACAVAGVALTQKPQETGIHPAVWCSLAASVFTAFAMLGLNRLRGVTPLGIVVHFSAVSTVFGVTAWFVFDRTTGFEPLNDPMVPALLIGVGATATIGQVFLTLAFSRGTATKVAVVGLAQVVMVMIAEHYVEHKTYDWLQIAGTALVLGPTAWLMARERHHAVAEDAPPVEEVAIE